ncbi:MAG: hypothetical protein LC794_17935 [Acidobacteria bacterium]|nr:hypothetical protein [Acidobacteriota bacterium]
MHHILFVVLILIGASVVNITSAQSGLPRTENSSLCSGNTSIDTIRQQIEFTKTFDSTPQRITVLIRAADLLWILEENRARSVFTEAVELASQNFKEANEKPSREGRLAVETPDHRYTNHRRYRQT